MSAFSAKKHGVLFYMTCATKNAEWYTPYDPPLFWLDNILKKTKSPLASLACQHLQVPLEKVS
jgi:hypothetical protein